MNVVVSLVLELLFLSQTLKTASITDTAQVLKESNFSVIFKHLKSYI